jgi:putative redox protein
VIAGRFSAAGRVDDMSRKTSTVTLDGAGLRFVAETGTGHRLVLDDGEGDSGPRPAELVPLAVAACTAMDVASILRKKRQDVTSYRVKAAGIQRDEQTPHVFTRIDIVHLIDGRDMDLEAVRRSIELSATRYCSVGGTLATGVTEIHHGYVVRSGATVFTGQVVVTGPYGAVELNERALAGRP